MLYGVLGSWERGMENQRSEKEIELHLLIAQIQFTNVNTEIASELMIMNSKRYLNMLKAIIKKLSRNGSLLINMNSNLTIRHLL